MIDFEGLTGKQLEEAENQFVFSYQSLQEHQPERVESVNQRIGVVPNPEPPPE